MIFLLKLGFSYKVIQELNANFVRNLMYMLRCFSTAGSLTYFSCIKMLTEYSEKKTN